LEFGVGHLDAGGICVWIELATDLEASELFQRPENQERPTSTGHFMMQKSPPFLTVWRPAALRRSPSPYSGPCGTDCAENGRPLNRSPGLIILRMGNAGARAALVTTLASRPVYPQIAADLLQGPKSSESGQERTLVRRRRDGCGSAAFGAKQ